MIDYEYKTVCRAQTIAVGEDTEELDQWLKDMGEDGWQLFQAIPGKPFSKEDYWTEILFIFRKTFHISEG